MCRVWYTGGNNIRTRGAGIRVGGEVGEGETFVTLAIVDDDLQMVVVDVDGIDEGFDHVAAEEGIVPVAFREAVEEEDHAVVIQQLRLGITEGLHGVAEGFRLVLQGLQPGGGGGIPDALGDRVVDVVDLFLHGGVFRLHRGEGRGLQRLLLEGHDGAGDGADHLVGEGDVQDEIDHGGLQAVLREGFFRAALPGFPALTGVITMAGAVL